MASDPLPGDPQRAESVIAVKSTPRLRAHGCSLAFAPEGPWCPTCKWLRDREVERERSAAEWNARMSAGRHHAGEDETDGE